MSTESWVSYHGGRLAEQRQEAARAARLGTLLPRPSDGPRVSIAASLRVFGSHLRGWVPALNGRDPAPTR